MCIGIPLEIAALEPGGEFGLGRGRDGREERLDLRLVTPLAEGAWVLAFAGSARAVLSAEEAGQIADALAAAEAVLRGENVDHLFADLVGREPTLPDFLRQPETEPTAEPAR